MVSHFCLTVYNKSEQESQVCLCGLGQREYDADVFSEVPGHRTPLGLFGKLNR